MRKAVLTKLKRENFYNYSVLIFVNNKPIGTHAFFHTLYQTLKFMDECKVEYYSITFEEDYKWKENI